MNALSERQALQNAANDLKLTVFLKIQEDKRKTINKFFATSGKETVSPVLDYEQMNHFLLGWRNAIKHINQ